MRQLILGGVLLAFCAPAFSATVRVRITNLAPENGTFLTPFWVGFHNGTFDLYDLGAPASMELERIAEDGDTGPLTMAFPMSGAGTVQGTLGGGPIAPGQTVSMLFTLDSASMMSRYFSYASMIIPSNDFFIANANPMAHQVFDAKGKFTSVSFIVPGTQVRDAGTEVNDELPMNTAFFGQMMPDTGVDENGVITVATGFLPAAPGNILGTPMFANADFTAMGYQVARIDIQAVPEPASMALMTFGLLGLALWRRRGTAGQSGFGG
jgi:hypothetical protein